jgi:hypothetical protein
MGWSIAIKETKKGTQYRIKCSVSDKYITKWLYKNDIIKFIFWYQFDDFLNKFLETALTFPNKYHKLDGERIYDDIVMKDFHEIRERMIKTDGLSWDMFIEECKKLGINLNISDGEFYINNND